MKFKTRQKAAIGFLCFFLALLIALNVIICTFFDMLNALVCGTFSEASAEQIDDSLAKGKALADEIQGEGIVLVKNENGSLPLGAIKKVNVFGWASTQWVYGGSGSGRCTNVDTDFLAALDQSGVEYNRSLTDMYRNFRSDRPFYNNMTGSLNSYNYEFSRLYEPSVEDGRYYSDALLAEAKSFSDTAIVVIGRVSGESNDSPKVQYKQTEKKGEIVTDAERTYLEISREEEKLLEYAGKNYENVVVLINSTNTMELGFLDTVEGIDSCLIVGATGEDAATAVVKVLYGEVNPSGKTVDTYAYEFETNPSYVNAGMEGEGSYTNSSGLYPCGTHNANVGDGSAVYESVYYVDYVENIYVGYKWYETADEEGFWNEVDNEYGTGYEGVVQFPFGFGMSYTEFSWKIEDVQPAPGSALQRDDTITVKVRVKNEGDVAGKEVVQLYYSAPYFENEIEKSSVELCAFAKTGLLEKGEEETVTLSFNVYDMASYDCYGRNGNDFKGYEVEASKEQSYVVSVRRDAHTPVDSVEYSVDEDILYPTDPDTGAEVKNRFTGEDAEDGVSLDGSDSDANIVWLSRADFEGTFPYEIAPNRAMTDNVKFYNLYTEEMAVQWAKDSQAQPVTTGKDNGIVVYDGGITETGMKLGLDYNNTLWESLLDQLTLKELKDLCAHLYLMPNMGIPSIGKYKAFEADGPTQIGSFNTARHGTGFPMPTVIAQTWNIDLVSAFGSHVGLEAANLGFDGWYAPGINIHRSPFGGRNYEYYSEDEFLSGTYCAEVVNRSLDRGVYCYIKHFIAYDQDANRDSLYVWMNEQSLREVYLKPFEIAVKAGATGLMSSYNRLGAVWTGGSSALARGVLRGEWGFKGAILTDYCDHPEYVSSDQFLRAGGDQILYGFGGNVSFRYETESNAMRQELRRAAKNSIYIWLNALARNEQLSNEGKIEARALRAGGGWLGPVLIVADVLAFAGLAFWGYTLYRKGRKNALEE